MTNWWVVQTETQREHMVRLLLMRANFLTYLPRIKHRSRIAPLFPGYLFVGVADRFYPVLKTVGVVRMLMAGDRPAHLADKVIAAIRDRERGGFVKLPAPEPIKKGQNIRVLNGNFCGHIGLYDGISGKERARILLQLLGQSVAVELPEKDVALLNVVASQSRLH